MLKDGVANLIQYVSANYIYTKVKIIRYRIEDFIKC